MKGYSFTELAKLVEAAMPRAGGAFSGNVSAPKFLGPLQGNADTATVAGRADKLSTARNITIGSTTKAFDGTGNLSWSLAEIGAINESATVAAAHKWATPRGLQIGNSSKAVDGSTNVAWSLAEMGAAQARAEVSYGTTGDITTSEFVAWLVSLGAFDTRFWFSRGNWTYAKNKTIVDTGVGNIHLAGCTIEVMSANTINYTIRVITPTTSANGGTTGAEFVYVNNGDDYAPGWRRIYTTAWKPTASDVGLSNVPNTVHTTAETANTVAVRDSSGDIHCRLLRSTFRNDTGMSGALAFRVNNSDNNYLRFTSDADAVRNWLDAVNKAGDTITGALSSTSTISATQFYATSNGAGKNVLIGNDAWFGDVNISNTIRLMGNQDSAKGYLIFGNGDSTALGRSGTGDLTYGGYTVWHSGDKHVAVLSGVIGHGGTIPLPSGFTEAQCKWLVSMNTDNPNSTGWDINESGAHLHYKQQVYTTGRVVTAQTYLGSNNSPPGWISSTANYIIIGVK